MKDVNLILEKLEEVQRYNGIGGVVIAIALIIGFLLLWIYLTRSIESKAVLENNKNLEKFKSELQENIGTKIAQQQAEISKGLASYKADLDKDLSKLSSELSMNNSVKIEVKNEERKAIIEYLNSYSEWLYGSLEIQILDYKYQNYEDINNKLSDINLAYSKTNIATNKMQFWTTNHDLIAAALQINKKTLELSHFTQSKLGSLRHNLSWGKIYTDSFKEVIKDFESHKEYVEFLAAEDKRIQSENDQLYREYWSGKLEIYTEVLKINGDFQALAKKYLIEIN